MGWAQLSGVRVRVVEGVFVPRRRSELLVREAILAARSVSGRLPVVVDMCCGSGAVGAAVLAHVGADLHAADVDAVAVACARGNLEPLGGHVHKGDLFTALPDALRERVDVLVANAPYVPTSELGLLPADAREHEPWVALDGGSDGVELHRRVASDAPRWLRPGGVLLIETSERQEPLTRAAVEAAGLAGRTAIDHDLDACVVLGERD